MIDEMLKTAKLEIEFVIRDKDGNIKDEGKEVVDLGNAGK